MTIQRIRALRGKPRRSKRLGTSPLVQSQRQVGEYIQSWLPLSEEEQDWQLERWERSLKQTHKDDLHWIHLGLVEWIDTLETLPRDLTESESDRFDLMMDMYHVVNRVRDPQRLAEVNP